MADQPGDIESLGSWFVPIVSLWFGPRAAVSDDVVTMIFSAREDYAFDEPQTADPVDPRGGNAQLVDERELVPADSAFLQLDTGGVGEPLVDGTAPTVETPILFTDPSTPPT